MAHTAFILILASEESKGAALAEMLRQQHGHACRVVTTLDEARESIAARRPDVVVAVDRAEGRDTITPLIDALVRTAPDATLLAVGRDGPPEQPESCPVPFVGLDNPTDDSELVGPIGREASKAVARREDLLLKERIAEHVVASFQGIVGVSPSIQRIIERIKKAARNKLTVLILGETGTGKELIARAIHNCSDRVRKPFKWLNCAGLSETLIESELFGHVKGAFTGATVDRKGHFAAADGGTLFLDEIGDMPFPMQAKLLRVLEHREFTPVGSTEIKRVDVRVVAATNADLRRKIEEREFREDLYYRLNQWVIDVPPLRERRQDIAVLALHLLEKANADNGVSVPSISSDALKALTRHHWPGNVRELTNVINRAACEVETRQIEEDDLPAEIRGTRDIVPVGAAGIVGLTRDQLDRLHIEATLRATGGNREQAAKMLNIGTRTLYRKIKEYDLQ